MSTMSTSVTTPSHGLPPAGLSWSDFEALAPELIAQLRGLSQCVEAGGLEKGLIELIKVRASQLNGCAFCLHLHLQWARRLGVSGDKLDLLPVWTEVGIYSPEERAALAWTEALTRVGEAPIPASLHQALRQAFAPEALLALTTAVATINAWNRIAVAMQLQVRGPAAA